MSVTLTHEQLQTLIANAIRSAQQPANEVMRVPAPPSYAEPDLRRALSNVMSFPATRASKFTFIWQLLKRVWQTNPDAFVIQGRLHTTATGDRTYFSVRVSHDDIYYNIHYYGSLRGSMFKVNSVSVKYFSEVYDDVWKYHTPGGSGSSVASDEF